MYAQRSSWLLLALLLAVAGPGRATAQLSENIAGWSDVAVGLSTTKWRGQRVPFPVPAPAPHTVARIDSQSWPISVHAGPRVDAKRLADVLAAAETTYLLWSAAGFGGTFGDGGHAGSGGRDLYVVDSGENGARLAASIPLGPLDAGRAFSVVDARLPRDRVFVCTAQALLEAELYELDPAEAASLRKSSAAYFAYLMTGELGCHGGTRGSSELGPFAREDGAMGAAWLVELGARQDRNRGTFLFDMWQFARQRTWEGRDLRASPDLIEVIAKALELQREPFSLVSAELAERLESAHPSARELVFAALPAFIKDVALEPLGSLHVLVRLQTPRTGRLRVFSSGELGGRYALVATRRSRDGKPPTRLELEPRRDPSGQLSVELDAQTSEVLITLTHVDDGIPDFDEPTSARKVALTIDHKE